MKELSRFVLVFSVAFAVFLIGPALLPSSFPAYPLITVGDVFDTLTPLVLLPLYWLFLRRVSPSVHTWTGLVFALLSALWAAGQGMHLAANSIGHQLRGTEGSNAHELTSFYDEKLSHYIWHVGVIGLSSLLMYTSWQADRRGEASHLGFLLPACLIYGLTYFIIVIEAGTAPIGLPFAVVASLVPLLIARRSLLDRAGLAFFAVGYLISVLLFAGWALYWGGLPEFSEVGIIQ